MSKFNFPKRFDKSAADDGVWFEVFDENEVSWGEFKCRLIDETLPRWRVTIERMQRKYPDDKTRTDAAKRLRAAETFVELSLLDWKLPSGEPYSREDAIDFLSDPDGCFAVERLFPFAKNVLNYQPKEQTKLPEGN